MIFPAVLLILILLVVFAARLKLSLITRISIDRNGFDMEVKVMLYRLITLFSWNLEEGGVSFLFKKKEKVSREQKKKKGRLSGILNTIFSRDSYHHLRRHLEVLDVSVRGRIACRDAAATALIFGSVWGVLGTLIPLIPQKRLILDFYPDFKSDIPDFHVSCILRVRIIHIIVLIVNHQRKKMRKGRSESYGTASY